MKYIVTFILCLCVASYLMANDHTRKRSIVEVKVPASYNKSYLEFQVFAQSKVLGVRSVGETKRCEVVNGIARLVINDIDELTYIRSELLSGVIEPADSIRVEFLGEKANYHGEGQEKFEFEREFKQGINLFDKINSLNPGDNIKIVTYADYQNRIETLNRKDSLIRKLLNSYTGKIKSEVLLKYKVEKIASLEEDRLRAFDNLSDNASVNSLSAEKLCEIFDFISNSSNSRWLRSISENVSVIYYYYRYIRHLHERKFNFDKTEPRLNNQELRKVEYFNLATQVYKGHVLEKYLAYLMTESVFKELGFQNEVAKKLMKLYYNLPGMPEYRTYVRNRETFYRAAHVGRNEMVPDFKLYSHTGKEYNPASFKGKLALICFLPPMPEENQPELHSLKILRKEFKNDSLLNIIFIPSFENGRESKVKSDNFQERRNEILLYAEDPEVIKEQFNVLKLPTLALVDYNGRIIQNPIPDPSIDSSRSLINTVRARLNVLNEQYVKINYDGPYVFYKRDRVAVMHIEQALVKRNEFVNAKIPSLTVATDKRNRVFTVQLKDQHETEPGEFARPEKLIVLSDIEGNFDAFRKLLQANNVIDKDFNWSFGNGHLVFAGDMFDRGEQVTECLWLIYSLEEKAKEAGGYVHFVLGNHEIMNLSNKINYVQYKYKENASKMGVDYRQLFDNSTELGRWLRTKNIMLKLGDLLFLHGGVSPQVNRLPFTLKEINEKARPFYALADSAGKIADPVLNTLYNTYESPFWYRHFYIADHYSKTYQRWVYKATHEQIDSTLKKFMVNHIITGHTIVSDTISVHYDGKVLNTDTRHAKGKSEALLIDNNLYYRVNSNGERILLFSEEKNKAPGFTVKD